MNRTELHHWKNNFKDIVWEGLDYKTGFRDKKSIKIDGVSFWESRDINTIDFGYKKMQGFLSADNSYHGKEKYSPLLKGILVRDMGGTVHGKDGTLEGFAKAVKEYWENFIK